GEPLDAAIAVAAGGNQLFHLLLLQPADLPEAEAHRMPAIRLRLERAIPNAEVHVHLAHLDTMAARGPHELGGLIEANRLAVGEGGAEHVRIVPLDPGRRIDKECKARGVALREAVFAKTLDLVEAALGEIARVAAPRHAGDEFFAEEMHIAVMAE